jgi:hypothetical protein
MIGGQGRELPSLAGKDNDTILKDNALDPACRDLPASLGGVGFS